MCKDIKQLDTAKKNLTFSITALKKFIMMLTALEKLQSSIQKKEYKEVANLISAYSDFSNYFKKYQSIPQLIDMNKQMDALILQLKQQILQDFSEFSRGASMLAAQDMADSCKVVEILGVNFHKQVVNQIC